MKRQLPDEGFGPLHGIPFGAVLVGVLIEKAGLIPTIVGMGIVYVAATLVLSLNPLRRMERPDSPF